MSNTIGSDASTCPGRLVLVEDDLNVLSSLTLMLRARGFSVDGYENGYSFLSIGLRSPVDCLLIDYKMPRMNGIELLKEIRARGVHIPALLITGFLSTTLASRAADAGFLDVIEKPSIASNLLKRIAEIIV